MSLLDEKLLAQLKKMKINPVETFEPVQRLPTGSLALDLSIGGGWARGRNNMLWGEESRGKTLIALLTAAETLRRDDKAVVIWFDTQGTHDPGWAERLGVDLSRFVHINQDGDAETLLDQMLALIEANVADAIIVDDFDGLLFSQVAEGEMHDNIVGRRALKMAQFYTKQINPLRLSKTAVIWINQMRYKIGGQGNPEEVGGGLSHKHNTSIRVKLLAPERVPLDTKKPIQELIVHTKSVKNKTALNGQESFIHLRYSPYFGVDLPNEIAQVGKALQVFTKEDGSRISGACSWHFRGIKLGTGEGNAANTLAANQELMDEAESAVREAMSKAVIVGGTQDDASDE